MPTLKRTASVSTTMSMLTERKTKYQKALGILNVYTMLWSLAMMAIGTYLIKSFHMDKIYVESDEGHLNDLWSYRQLPWLLVCIGITTLVVTTIGFLFLGLEAKPPLFVYSCLLGLLIVTKVYFLYVTLNANNKIAIDNQRHIQNALENDGMTLYLGNKSMFRDNWNTIQHDFRCCGFESGYLGGEDYMRLGESDLKRFKIVSDNRCVPDSCCIKDAKDAGGVLCQKRDRQNCGMDLKENVRNEQKMEQVNIRPCPHVIQEMYERFLPTLFTIIGIIAAQAILVEIITIALALASVAHITRRAKRYQEVNNMNTKLTEIQ